MTEAVSSKKQMCSTGRNLWRRMLGHFSYFRKFAASNTNSTDKQINMKNIFTLKWMWALSLCFLSCWTASAQQAQSDKTLQARQAQTAASMKRAAQLYATQPLRAAAGTPLMRAAEEAAPSQDPKTLTNLPADSAIFFQNFIPSEAGDTLGFSTMYDVDLLEYFVGNTITQIQTIVPDGASHGTLWILDPNHPTDTLFRASVPQDCPKGEPVLFSCGYKIDSLRLLQVGLTLVFEESMPADSYLQVPIVPCNRNGAFLVLDTKVSSEQYYDYTYMRYMLYGDPHLCYGFYLNCITEGDAGLKPYEIKLDDVTHTRAYIGEEEATFSIGITNYGYLGIPSAKLRCKLGDLTEDIDFNKSLGYMYYGYIETDLPTPREAVRVPLTAQIIEVAGQDVSAEQSPESGSITMVSPSLSVLRRAVMEEFTGGWCGWCPRGSRAIELLSEKYGESFIPIAIHQGDDLQSDDFLYVLSNYGSNGFPGFSMNRLFTGDPYYGSGQYGGGDLGVTHDIDHVAVLPCEADLEITDCTLDAQGTAIQVTTATSFSIDCNTAPYKLVYVLTEDSLQVAQSNYYSTAYGGSTDSTPDDLDYLVSLPGKYWAEANHVARSMTAPTGIEGSISAPIVKGETQTYTYSVPVSDNVANLANSNLVVLLLDSDTGEILNADAMSLHTVSGLKPIQAGDAPQVSVVAGRLCVSGTSARVAVYNAAGQQVVQRTVDGQAAFRLPAGCYVVRTVQADGMHTAKVLVP